MARLSGILFLLLHSVPNVLAQLSALAGVPTCGLLCLESAIANSSCAATNTTCTCLDTTITAEVTTCVGRTCTVKESLLVTNATSTICHAPIRDKTAVYNTLSNVLVTTSAVLVLVRVLSKFYLHTDFGADDYLVVLVFLSGVPTSILTVHGLTSNGLGKDIWTSTPKQITDFIHNLYAAALIYIAQVALLKLSLLNFYSRIFPGPKIKWVIWSTSLVVFVYGVVFLLIGIFQCYPIDYYWKSWDFEHKGKCLNINVFAWSNAVISIVLDVWMIGIPISQLIGLQLHWKKKLSVSALFLLGTFITIISILRLQSLVHFSNSQNPTWEEFDAGVWSTAEINVGIICVCMPNIRLLLVRLFPKALGTTSPTHAKNYLSNSHSQVNGNISVNRPQKRSKANPLSNDGIVKSHNYTVQYTNGRETDELELMERGALETTNFSKPSSQIRKISVESF